MTARHSTRASATRAGKTDPKLNGAIESLINFEAEESTLGAIFLSGGLIDPIVHDGLLPDDFYKEQHRQVYRAMLALHQEGLPVDVLTVTDRLRESGQLEEAGGESGIAALTGPVPLAGNARQYAAIVRRLARQRKVQQLATRVAAAPDDQEARAALQPALGEITGAGTRYRLLTAHALAELPAPEWLLQDMLPQSGLGVIYGPSGGGKSFLALDWSLCIAAGLPWYGQPTQPGAVIFIAAEGTAGLNQRVDAWITARDHNRPDLIHFLPDAVNFLDPDCVERARQTLDQLPEAPTLIVVDTMARSMVGGEENSARDVGLFIANLDRLRHQHNAAALIVHHTGKTGEDERGSSALRGAADMMHSLKPDGASLRLRCEKAKDSEPYDPWHLHLHQTAESCVLRPGSNPGVLSEAERQILETLPAAFGSEPAPAGKLLAASNVPERSFYRAAQSLQTRGFINVEQSGRTKLYHLTTTGAQQLLPTTANNCHGSPSITAATPPTLGGGSGSNDDTANTDQGAVS